MGPFFLAFGLGYTGRSELMRNPLFGIVAAVPLVTIPLVVTNPRHGLVWTDFVIDPVFGLSTVSYAIQPWGVFAVLFCVGTAAVGSLALIETIISYGPLYRKEATAVILSTVPPTVGVLVWLFELGSVPQLHLTASLMVIHVSLDTFAFVGTHMFDTNPTTQRAAEQSALEDLNEPLVVVDPDERVVNLNRSAEELFPVDEKRSLPMPLAELTGSTLDELRDSGELSHRGTYAVSYTPLTHSGGESVGGLVVFYDVTEQQQRKQQLAVLHRVLRHNLRNELTVVQGYAETLQSTLTDSEQSTQAETIMNASGRLLSIAEKVQKFERIQERKLQPSELAVEQLLTEIETDLRATYPAADIEWTIEADAARIHTDLMLLSVVLSNLIENALDHAAVDRTTVEIHVSTAETDDTITEFELRDANDRIPNSELEPIRAGDETALKHGLGVGLWIINWCVTMLDGEIAFSYDNGNVVTVSVPQL